MKFFSNLLILILLLFFTSQTAHALCMFEGEELLIYNPTECDEFDGTWTNGVSSGGGQTSCEGNVCSLSNPLPGSPTIPVLLGKIINAVLGIVGSLALVMFIYGGFTWMLAAGSPEKVKKGRDIIIWAAIGLVVIFSAYALVRIVFTGLGATT